MGPGSMSSSLPCLSSWWGSGDFSEESLAGMVGQWGLKPLPGPTTGAGRLQHGSGLC